MKKYSLKSRFNACLALNETNVKNQALAWGVDESTLRKVLNGKGSSKRLMLLIEDYIEKSSLNKVLKCS